MNQWTQTSKRPLFEKVRGTGNSNNLKSSKEQDIG